MQEGLCWRDQESVKTGSAHVSSLACDQECGTGQSASSQGKLISVMSAEEYMNALSSRRDPLDRRGFVRNRVTHYDT